MRIGAHISISKGLPRAAVTAIGIGANTFQFFSRNPRGGAARKIGAEEISRWKVKRDELGLAPVIAHLPYTVNLGSDEERLVRFARMVVTEDLQRAGQIGAEFVVTHPGRHGEDGREESLGRVVQLLEAALGDLEEGSGTYGKEAVPEGVPGTGPMLLLETMAGQGTELGLLEDLQAILEGLGWHERVGVCLDSAHLFAGGWNLVERGEVDRLVEKLDATVGLDRVKVMHLNDSTYPCGSRRDRHAVIGEGELGLAGIENIVNHPFLGQLPLVLETQVKEYSDYKPQIQTVKELAGKQEQD